MPVITQGFAPQHGWDRNAFLGIALLGWLGIVMGFAGDMAHHFATHAPAYLPIVHVHAVAFVGWLVLFTVQILLIRARQFDLHKKLGLAMAILAVVMVVLGPLAEIMSQARKFGTPRSDPAFLSISITVMIAFAGLVGAAILLRKDSSAHKRLMILATLHLTSAGYARWHGAWLGPLVGRFDWGIVPIIYFGSTMLMLCLGAYDLVTRRRLHPAYMIGMVWILLNIGASYWLYRSPEWLAFTKHLIGH